MKKLLCEYEKCEITGAGIQKLGIIISLREHFSLKKKNRKKKVSLD